MKNTISIGRFNLDYESIALGLGSQISLIQDTKYSIKAEFNDNYERTYIISHNNKEIYKVTPKNEIIVNKRGLPKYIFECIVSLYKFEFSRQKENKDILVSSLLLDIKFNTTIHDKIIALLVKLRFESFLRKDLKLLGLSGLLGNCLVVDADNEIVSKFFLVNKEHVSVDINKKIKTKSGSLDEVNLGDVSFAKIATGGLLVNSLRKD